jgi:CYTH domain-containing protein
MLPPEAVATDIVQTYLFCEGPGERRVRSSTTRGEMVFTYTEKRPTGERGTRDEKEEVIDEARYRQLLTEQDPATVPIEKTRYCFTYAGHRFELDVYTAGRPRDEGLVVLEIELRDINEPVDLPPDWELEDITDNKAFKNRSLARKVS